MVNLGRSAFIVVVVELLLFLCAEVSCQQNVTLRSGIERSALLELRSSLGLRGKDWPIKSDPCSFWIGVKCLNGSVTGLNISGLRRTRLGKLNPQFAVDGLANLTKLESFNSSGFLLPGSIPDLFGSELGSLRVLDLSSCAVSGIIPSSLGNLSSLDSLYLSNNNLTGTIPSSLGRLPSLSVLDVSKNTLTGLIPSSFSTLGNLSILDMSSNFLSGSIPAQLGNLANLTDLDLSLNSLSGTLPPELGGMTHLQRLVMSNNTFSGSVPNDLLANMSQLQYLDLHHNNFSGTLPVIVWSMSGLHFLDVSGNNFTGSLPDHSLVSNATDKVFNLSQNTFYGNLTSVVTGFTFIDLSENYFEGKVQNDVLSNASLGGNCLQTVPDQRTSAECASFYSEKGLIFDNFGDPTPPAKSSGSGNKRRTIILASVLGAVALIILLALVFVILFFCVRRRGGSNKNGNGVGPVPTGGNLPTPGLSLDLSSLGEAFTYQQLLLATGEFDESNLIKHGHSGDLFRGILEGGISIVVKRIDLQSVKKEEYLLELEFCSKVSHTRLVPLLGHCIENENEKFLVYKYMPNRDLSSSLFRKANSEDDSLQSLDWITRLKIATGVAEGLSYLHHECNPPLVHRDVQASSILLDDKFEVRLGSLSEVCVQEGDTHQNRITRLLRLPQTSEQASSGPTTANCAYDVFCFGKVLLELVTGKLGISSSSDTSWIEQIVPHISIYDKELVTKIVDPTLLIDDDLLEEVWAMAVVARSCLNPKPSRRPLMRYILKALENPLKVVREENSSSTRLKETSSRGSWNAALFGSWRHSSLDVVALPTTSAQRPETASSLKQSGTSGSLGSGKNSQGGNSSSRRRHSNEICPEPSGVQDVERQGDD